MEMPEAEFWAALIGTGGVLAVGVVMAFFATRKKSVLLWCLAVPVLILGLITFAPMFLLLCVWVLHSAGAGA